MASASAVRNQAVHILVRVVLGQKLKHICATELQRALCASALLLLSLYNRLCVVGSISSLGIESVITFLAAAYKGQSKKKCLTFFLSLSDGHSGLSPTLM